MPNFYFPLYNITLQKDLKTSSLLSALCVKQKLELSASSSLVPTLGLPLITDSVVSKTGIAWSSKHSTYHQEPAFRTMNGLFQFLEEQLAAKHVLFFGGANTVLIKANSQSFGI